MSRTKKFWNGFTAAIRRTPDTEPVNHGNLCRDGLSSTVFSGQAFIVEPELDSSDSQSLSFSTRAGGNHQDVGIRLVTTIMIATAAARNLPPPVASGGVTSPLPVVWTVSFGLSLNMAAILPRSATLASELIDDKRILSSIP